MIDLTPVLQAAVILVAAVITTFLVPYIKSKNTAEEQAQLKKWAKIGVAAAEQIFTGSLNGEEKKNYVMEFLKEKGYNIDSITLNALIESEVHNLWSVAEIKEGEYIGTETNPTDK